MTWSRDLLFNSGIPQYFRKGESYKLPEVVNSNDGNLRAEPPSWFRGRTHSGRERKRGGVRWALPHETEHLHTRQSIFFAVLFKDVLNMLKISQSVTFSHIDEDHLSHPPRLYQPEASYVRLVSSKL